MSSKKNDDQKLADQANELYWRSEQSVNQIADSMDLSKSGLYALVRPLSAERPCPECGEGLVFSNRTTEQKAIASCPKCEYMGAAAGPRGEARAAVDPSPKQMEMGRGTEVAPRTGAEPRIEKGSETGLPRRGGGGRGLRSSRILWASVLLGAAAGLYLTRRSR